MPKFTIESAFDLPVYRHRTYVADMKQERPSLFYELWPEVGQMLNLTRNGTYDAVKRGDIPTMRFGKLIRVPKLAFDRMLHKAGVIDLPCTDHEAMLAIQELMDGVEWTSETMAAIANIVIDAGYTVRDPDDVPMREVTP